VAHVAAGQDATVETFTANGRSSLLGSIARRGVTITVEEEASHG